jgi:hypothetical protein
MGIKQRAAQTQQYAHDVQNTTQRRTAKPQTHGVQRARKIVTPQMIATATHEKS